MNENYRIPVRVRVFRALFRPVFRGLFHVLGRVKITGLENVPPGGAYIIAINHISYYEAPFLIAFWPIAPEAMTTIRRMRRTQPLAGAGAIGRPGNSALSAAAWATWPVMRVPAYAGAW